MAYQANLTGKGERDCTERWDWIRGELPERGVVLDVGAAEGFFCRAIADETQLLAVGLERERKRIFSQERWLDESYEGKIVSCLCRLDTQLSEQIRDACDWFDVTLLLSVIHWMGNPDAVLHNLGQMSGKMIIEIPHLDDHKATGQKFLNRVRELGSEERYFNEVTGRSVRHLATVQAHTHATRNLWVIEGDLVRQPPKPNVDFTGKSGRRYRVEFVGGEYRFFKEGVPVDWVPGVNTATLRRFGVVFPKNPWWRSQVEESTRCLGAVNGDVRLHNLITTRGGVHWIDLDDRRARRTIEADIESLGAPRE